MAEAADATRPGLGEDLRALALISLGSTEFWAFAWDDAERHLESGIALARRIGRPYLEFTGLAYQAPVMNHPGRSRGAPSAARQAIELAERHGWTDDPASGLASTCPRGRAGLAGKAGGGGAMAPARRTHPPGRSRPARPRRPRSAWPRSSEMARNRDAEALAAFQAAERLAGGLACAAPRSSRWIRAMLLLALVRLGADRASRAVPGRAQRRTTASTARSRIAAAALRLAQGTRVPRPPRSPRSWTARRRWPGGTGWPRRTCWRRSPGTRSATPAPPTSALERALDLAEPDGLLLPFLLHPAPGLLERHARHRTAHASLLAEIQAACSPEPSRSPPRRAAAAAARPLSESEIRVLRYLPTNLTAPEIARELYVSPNTVGPICAACTPSSAPTTGPRPSNAPAPSACSPPPGRAAPTADGTITSGTGQWCARPTATDPTMRWRRRRCCRACPAASRPPRQCPGSGRRAVVPGHQMQGCGRRRIGGGRWLANCDICHGRADGVARPPLPGAIRLSGLAGLRVAAITLTG